MSSSEYHEAVFRWPNPDANSVIVTGEFDSWTGSTRLSRTASGFEGVVKVPWGRKVPYKYIVDGRWTTTDGQPTELDSIGNLNNVYNAPARPPTPKASAATLAPEPTAVASTLAKPGSYANGVLGTVKKAAVEMAEAIAPGTAKTPLEEQATDTPKAAPEVELPKGVPEVQGLAAVPEDVATPAERITTEVILPTAPESAPVAPTIPVPVLPLTAAGEAHADNGKAEPVLETTIVEGSATSETVKEAEPSTEVTSEPAAQPSTHTPAANGGEALANGAHSEEPQEIPLPAPTPSEIPVPTTPIPSTPAANGKSVDGASTTTSPPASAPSSPRKEKRAFPTFGKHRRHSSNASITTSTGTPDDRSISESPSRSGTIKKKRTSSIFGKLGGIFSHDHKEKKKAST